MSVDVDMKEICDRMLIDQEARLDSIEEIYKQVMTQLDQNEQETQEMIEQLEEYLDKNMVEREADINKILEEQETLMNEMYNIWQELTEKMEMLEQ